MERSGSQKFLLVISIINIVIGAFGLIAGLFAFVGGGLVGVMTPEMVAENTITTSEATTGLTAMFTLGFVAIVSSAIALVQGLLGVRAANNNQKIMPVWILTLISLALGIIGLVMSLVGGTIAKDGASLLGSLAGSALLFWIANNIKRQAGK